FAVDEHALTIAIGRGETLRLRDDLLPSVLGAHERLEVLEDRLVSRIGAPGLEERVDGLTVVAEIVTERDRDLDENLGALVRIGRPLEDGKARLDLRGSDARAAGHAQLDRPVT